jgi:hypothetical protein
MDIEKTMEFIVDQQASFAAGIQELRLSIQALKDHAVATDQRIEVHTEWLTGLSQSMQHLIDQSQAGFKEMREGFAETRENINLLVKVVHDIALRPPKQ